MPSLDTPSTPDQDYRASHLAKGGQYDANLAQSPFDSYMSTWERRHLPNIIEKYFPNGLQRYLDFACGTGRITSQIAPMAQQSTAVDISPSMIEEARRKCPKTNFFLGDLTDLDPDLGQFDLITSFRFFGNAQDELREGALKAISKRLAPGAHLIINSHRNPRALYALLERLTGGTVPMDLHLSKLRSLLTRHGLQVVGLQPIGAWMFRSSIMLNTPADSMRALKNEARFGSPALAAIAPDTIVIARKN